VRTGERSAVGTAILLILSVAAHSIIRSAIEEKLGDDEQIVVLTADRATLGKRRWRGVAEDGREFGFDLDEVLSHGSAFFREAGKCYVISQAAEPVLTIEIGQDPTRAAILAWQIGNLHFPIEVTTSTICCADDPAIRQMLQREQIAWRQATAVFRPFAGTGHAHHH
jgi:urease accessory protein